MGNPWWWPGFLFWFCFGLLGFSVFCPVCLMVVLCYFIPINMLCFLSFYDDLGTPPTWRPHSWKKKDVERSHGTNPEEKEPIIQTIHFQTHHQVNNKSMKCT